MSAPRTVELLVAARDGGVGLASAVGLPIVHVDAVDDARAALAGLNGGASPAGPRRPALSTGRGQWRAVPLTGDGLIAHAPGVRVSQGRIVVVLPRDVPLAGFRAHLRGALRHLQLPGVRRGADLYVVDPSRDAWRLFWIVAAARLSAVGRRRRRLP